mgnify:FL=1
MKRTKSRLAVWGVLFLAVLMLQGCSSNENSSDEFQDVWAEAGETVHTQLFDFTVRDVAVVDSYDILVPNDGNRLVRMELSVTNTSNEKYTMFAEDFQLQWGDGKEDFSTCLAAIDEDMTPYSYTLYPGDSYDSVMVVQIPEDADKLTVAYQEKLSDGEDGSAYFVEAEL